MTSEKVENYLIERIRKLERRVQQQEIDESLSKEEKKHFKQSANQEEEKLHTCRFCQKSFKNPRSLSNHIRNEVGDGKHKLKADLLLDLVKKEPLAVNQAISKLWENQERKSWMEIRLKELVNKKDRLVISDNKIKHLDLDEWKNRIKQLSEKLIAFSDNMMIPYNTLTRIADIEPNEENIHKVASIVHQPEVVIYSQENKELASKLESYVETSDYQKQDKKIQFTINNKSKRHNEILKFLRERNQRIHPNKLAELSNIKQKSAYEDLKKLTDEGKLQRVKDKGKYFYFTEQSSDRDIENLTHLVVKQYYEKKELTINDLKEGDITNPVSTFYQLAKDQQLRDAVAERSSIEDLSFNFKNQSGKTTIKLS